MTNDRKGKSIQSNEQTSEDDLSGALIDAKKLIRYASESGMLISGQIIKTILSSADEIGTDQWNDEKESAFWDAVSKLSKEVSPVTIESIQATLYPTRSKSRAGRETMWFSIITIIFLVALIVCQIYWVIGNNVSSEINSLREQNQKIELEIDAIKYSMGKLAISLSDLKNSEKGESRTGEVFYDSNSGEFLERLELNAKINDFETRVGDMQKKLKEKEFEHRKNYDFLVANYRILAGWVDYVLVESKAVNVDPDKPDKEFILTWARSIIQAMSTYVLPMLYGLVGACAYILRSLFTEIRQVTFHGASIINHRLRLPLGMLSGVAIGWFFKAETLSSELGSIQPLALAFIAGYSVELLFTAMDTLIGAFVRDEKKGKIA